MNLYRTVHGYDKNLSDIGISTPNNISLVL